MNDLSGMASAVGARLKAQKQTIGVAESSAGGLISAALLAIPGASAYFLGGGVIYTQVARRHSLEQRALRADQGARNPGIARRNVGLERDRGDGADREPLW